MTVRTELKATPVVKATNPPTISEGSVEANPGSARIAAENAPLTLDGKTRIGADIAGEKLPIRAIDLLVIIRLTLGLAPILVAQSVSRAGFTNASATGTSTPAQAHDQTHNREMTFKLKFAHTNPQLV